MPEFLVIMIILVMFIILLLSGLYIHSVLLACGIIGLISLEGFSILSGLLGNQPFTRAASYTLTTIPLFVLMAQFILQAGIVQDMFYMIHRLSRGNNSLLGALTIIVGGLLGAVSGSGTASAASLGQVAVPELTKHGYKPDLAAAIAASGGLFIRDSSAKYYFDPLWSCNGNTDWQLVYGSSHSKHTRYVGIYSDYARLLLCFQKRGTE